MPSDWFGNLQQGGLLGQALGERGLLARDMRSLLGRGVDPYGGGPFKAEDLLPMLRAGRTPWTPTEGYNGPGAQGVGGTVGVTGQNSPAPSMGVPGTISMDQNNISVPATAQSVGNAVAGGLNAIGSGSGALGNVASGAISGGNRGRGLLAAVLSMMGMPSMADHIAMNLDMEDAQLGLSMQGLAQALSQAEAANGGVGTGNTGIGLGPSGVGNGLGDVW